MNKQKRYIGIFLSLILSFIVVTGSSKIFFPQNTPVFRQNMGGYLATAIDTFVSRFKPLPTKDNVPLKMITKGVYAESRPNQKSSYTYYKAGEVNWTKYTFIVDGKEIIIRVPEGKTPPSQTDVAAMQ